MNESIKIFLYFFDLYLMIQKQKNQIPKALMASPNVLPPLVKTFCVVILLPPSNP